METTTSITTTTTTTINSSSSIQKFQFVEGHVFTDEFPDKEYKSTTSSFQVQSKFWPSYLPFHDDRLFLFERSKNAQLVVYYANYSKDYKLNPKWPMEIQWQSFGWTTSPTTNATGLLERKMAWGYSHKRVSSTTSKEEEEELYDVTLNALPARRARLEKKKNKNVFVSTLIQNIPSRLWKVYVCTSNENTFLPKVLYVELYGTSLAKDQVETYEKISLSVN